MGKLVVPIVLAVIGVVLAVGIAVLGWAVMPNIIDNQIEDEVRLIEDSETWDKWQKNPVPVYLDFYIFNVTNPAQVNSGEEQPNLEEFGPFVYEEIREKLYIQKNDSADTLSYTEKITYFFRRNMSVGSEFAHVYSVVNSPFLLVSQAIYSLPLVGPDLANVLVPLFTLFGEQLVRTEVSVQNMIFDGVPLHSIYGFLFSLLPSGTPHEFTGNRFAYYRLKNGTPEESYVVKTGIENSAEFGKIMRYNDMEILDYWRTPDWLPIPDDEKLERNKYCNMINGTDGSVFPPFVKKDAVLPIFVSDICRSIYLVYEGDIEHREIPGYRFGFPKEFFEDPVINENNYCFCTTPPANVTSICAAGVIRIFPCKSDAPLVTSQPHFLNAAEEFRALVNGLEPSEDLHATFIELEPNTGLMLRIDKKLQISLEIQPLDLAYFKNREHYLFPAFWANEHTQLDQELADDLFSKLLTPLKIIEVAKWTVLGIGIALIVAAAVVFIARR